MSPALAVGTALLLGQVDAGYFREQTPDGGHCLRWPVNARTLGEVTFVQSAAGDVFLGPRLFDAVSRAEGAWAEKARACSALKLNEGPRSASRVTGYDPEGENENLVLVRINDCFFLVGPGDPCLASGSCGNVYDCWDHGAALLATTLLTYDSNGVLLDVDIEINGALSYLSVVDSPPCTPGHVTRSCVGNDAQNAVTHEFGHALGLAHSPDPASTMYAIAPLGETSKRVLDPASAQFVCDVYPAGRPSRDCSGADLVSGGPGDGGADPPDGGPGPPTPGVGPSGPGCTSAAQSAPAAVLLAAVVLLLGTRGRAARRPRPD